MEKELAQKSGGSLKSSRGGKKARATATGLTVPRYFTTLAGAGPGGSASAGTGGLARVWCRDGFPDHGSFRDELTSLASPQLLLDAIAARERTVPDQWNVQVQASIQRAPSSIAATLLATASERLLWP